MLDAFRNSRPEKIKFSRLSTRTDVKTGITHISASRIDHFLITDNLLNLLEDCDIVEDNLFASDHRLVKLNLSSDIIPPHPTQHLQESRKFFNNKGKWKNDFKDSVKKKLCSLNIIPKSSDPHSYINNLNKNINTLLIKAINENFPVYSLPVINSNKLDPPAKNIKEVLLYSKAQKIAKQAISFITPLVIKKNKYAPILNEVLIKLISLNESYYKGTHEILLSASLSTILGKLEKT